MVAALLVTFCVEPSEYVAVTVNCWVAPAEVRVKLVGATVRPVWVGATVLTVPVELAAVSLVGSICGSLPSITFGSSPFSDMDFVSHR